MGKNPVEKVRKRCKVNYKLFIKATTRQTGGKSEE